MLESDTGVGRPLGFAFTGGQDAERTVRSIVTLLDSMGANRISPGGGSPDLDPVLGQTRIPALALDVDEPRYFMFHHTEADTVDKIDPREMARAAAAAAVMTYVIADLPFRLEATALGNTTRH
jgi:carboxypeptidase Q